MRKWLLIAMIVVLVGAFWLGGGVQAVRDFVTKGRRLSTSNLVDGVIEESIAELVEQASNTLGRPLEQSEYSLARMLRSEYGGGPIDAKVAMAWVAVNDAAALDRDLTWTINAGDRHGIAYGSQEGGQRYSTAQDPYENDLAIAEAVLGNELPDPTGGATKFVHTDALGNLPAGVAKWTDYSPVELAGDVGRLVVFRKDA